jgi:hypothetical protein
MLPPLVVLFLKYYKSIWVFCSAYKPDVRTCWLELENPEISSLKQYISRFLYRITPEFAILKSQPRITMTNEDQTQNDADFDYGCECAMTLLNEPTEDCLNDLIDELDEDGMISTEVVYGLLATILMSINEEDHEGDEH